MKKAIIFIATALVCHTLIAEAGQVVSVTEPVELSTTSQDISTIKTRIDTLLQTPVDKNSIRPTQLPNLYEVSQGSQVIYVSNDGRFLIRGDLIDLNQKINLTEARRSQLRTKMLGSVKPSDMIVFSPEKPKYTVTVFTDIDCAYCRKLHSDMKLYNKEGIAVRYMAFPRAGINSASYFKAVSVWCSKDRKTALTKAKAGAQVDIKTCNNPVSEEFKMGREIGVRGTPAIVLDNGTLLSGYVAPKALLSILSKKDKT